MATMLRIAVVALGRVRDYATAQEALRKCEAEWARGGSTASLAMVQKAEALVVAFASKPEMAEG